MGRRSEAQLEDHLGIALRDKDLLRRALTHTSYVHESADPSLESNERLEFLGDAFLGLVVGQELYERFPGLPEGQLTTLRATLVRSETLAEVASSLQLGDYLYLGKGEEQSGGRRRERNLARAIEALLGAILSDQGFEAAKEWTLGLFEDRLDALPDSTVIDDKSRLQEAIQAEGAPPPIYRTIDAQGPEHSKDFTVEVMVRERVLGTGRGSSKRRAQREAARQALERLAQGWNA